MSSFSYYDDNGHRISSDCTYVMIRIAGVTFKNGRRSRQTILRQIHWHDEPYAKTKNRINLNYREVEFEGEPAIEVWVQRDDEEYEQIGYVPKEKVKFFVDNWDFYKTSSGFEVYGGGKNSDGTTRSYGASVTLVFDNNSDTLRKYAAAEAEYNLERAKEKEREDNERPYRRAFYLLKQRYPDVTNLHYTKDESSLLKSINVTRVNASGVTERLCNVVYDEEHDSISVYYPDGSPIPHPKSSAARKKSSSNSGSGSCSGCAVKTVLFLLGLLFLFVRIITH